MYPETKRAVRRVLKICDLLWSLEPEAYGRLLAATDAVEMPTRKDALKKAQASLGKDGDQDEAARMADDILLKELKQRYVEAAEAAGFGREHGLAMLEYATLLMDLEDEDDWDA